MSKENVINSIEYMFKEYNFHTKVSSGQKGLEPNQIRLYQDNGLEREYFIVTVKKEYIDNK